MDIIEQFKNFASDFELAIEDDSWSRLGKYFADDATYLNVGGPDPTVKGRDEILANFEKDVTENDRKFETRTLSAVTAPVADGNRLSRQWRCTYRISGAPDLVLFGEARYVFEGNLIKAIEEEATAESVKTYENWMREHGSKLHA